MAESFETYQPYLFAIAYRMLGSAMDAEDMVQETYLRYQATPKDAIRSLKSFLTTVISRLCVDQLHLARRQREEYLGPWLPEPISATEALRVATPEERVDMDESISLAFLMLLERLHPIERAVFLLREVFEYDYAEIAAILDKSEVACRQSFSRAKKHLADHQPRFPASPDTHRQLLTSFYQAVQGGDLSALTHLLTEEVTLWADGGGKVNGVATRPMSGRAAVAAFILESSPVFISTLPGDIQGEIIQVNGQPGLVVRADGRVYSVLTIDIQDGQIHTIRFMANPEKLTRL
jgi:RNA polymerase sigma-70 factor, ECF subfamily